MQHNNVNTNSSYWLVENEDDEELKALQYKVTMLISYCQRGMWVTAADLIAKMQISIKNNASYNLKYWNELALLLIHPSWNILLPDFPPGIFNTINQERVLRFNKLADYRVFFDQILIFMYKYLIKLAQPAKQDNSPSAKVTRLFTITLQALRTAINNSNDIEINKNLDCLIALLTNNHLSQEVVIIVLIADLDKLLQQLYDIYHIKQHQQPLNNDDTVRTQLRKNLSYIHNIIKFLNTTKQTPANYLIHDKIEKIRQMLNMNALTTSYAEA